MVYQLSFQDPHVLVYAVLDVSRFGSIYTVLCLVLFWALHFKEVDDDNRNEM